MSDVSAIIIHIGKFSLQIQQSILVWLGICVFFAFFFLFRGEEKLRHRIHPNQVKGIVYICEEMYNLVLYVIKDNLRETTKKYIPLFGTLIVMMIVSNLIGLIGLQNPTSNVSFNATLAVTMWLMIQGNGIKKRWIISANERVDGTNVFVDTIECHRRVGAAYLINNAFIW